MNTATEALLEGVAMAVYNGLRGTGLLDETETPTDFNTAWGSDRVDSYTIARAVIAALGLDDLDAAVERGAKALVWEQHQGCVRWEDTTDSSTSGDAHTRNYAREHALAVLNAALKGER